MAIWAPGQVDAILPMPDGSVIIGGRFETVFDPASGLDVPRQGLAKFLPSGALDLAWNPRVTSLNRQVYDLERDSSNRIYVAGQFNSINNFSRQNVARLSATGAGNLDESWAPNVSNAVVDLTLDNAGFVYIGGFFTSVNGTGRNSLARLDAENGALDLTWNPDVRGSQFSGGVFIVAPKPGGDVYIGGGFNSVGGTTRIGLARIQRTGSGALDANWNPTQDQYALVYDLEHLPDGTLVVGGTFFEMGGLSRSCIAKVQADGAGAVVPTWDSSLSCGSVEDLEVDPSGSIYLAGRLSRQLGDPGTNRNVARLLPTGPIDMSWNASVDRNATAIKLDNAGRILVGGAFGNTGQGFSLAFTRLSPTDGSVALPHFIQQQGQINTAVPVGDGSVIVGGNFLRVEGQRRVNLFKVRPSGLLDPDWVVDTNEDVYASALDSQGRVIVGGRFTAADGLSRGRVFRAATTGSGEIDPLWNPEADNDVHAIAPAPDGSIYLGGNFQSMGGQPRLAVARVSGSGTGAVDGTWSMGQGGPGSAVYSMAVGADGSVFVGGSFDTFGGVPRAGLAKLSGTTGATLGWNPAATGGSFGPEIYQVLLDGLGSIYVRGDFTGIGGRSLRGVAKLVAIGSGSADPGWTASATSFVFSIALSPEGDLYAGGGSITDGAGFFRSLVRLPQGMSGAVDDGWNPSPDVPPEVLTIRADGSLFLGGQFRSVGGIPRQSIAVVPSRQNQVFSNGFE